MDAPDERGESSTRDQFDALTARGDSDIQGEMDVADGGAIRIRGTFGTSEIREACRTRVARWARGAVDTRLDIREELDTTRARDEGDLRGVVECVRSYRTRAGVNWTCEANRTPKGPRPDAKVLCVIVHTRLPIAT